MDEKEIKYGQDLLRIKVDTDDKFPLSKFGNFSTRTIMIRSVFEENGKYYPQIFLGECLYEL